MKVDVVIAGSGGFIGRLLTSALAGHGIETADIRAFARDSGTANVLVNLANIPGDPAADLRLLNERIALVGRRVDHWLQVQSFITLHGCGTLRLSRFNVGFTPTALNRYGVGKLMEERRLVHATTAGEVGALTFAYLPAVLDEGGPWARIRAQASRKGYVLPRRMSPIARANFMYISDLADVVLAWRAKSDLPAVTRLIVNDPLSRTTTWPELLGSRRLDPPQLGRSATFRGVIRDVKARASAGYLATAVAMGRLGPPVGGAAEAGSREPDGPVEFSGPVRLVVRQQGFLPPTSYT